MKNSLLFIFVFIFAINTFAKDQLIYFGAGGEPDGDTTQFDRTAQTFSNYYNKRKDSYETSIAFNGGHSQTEKIISENYTGANVYADGFNAINYNQIINNLKNKILSIPPQINSGEKILLFIDTHGYAPKSGKDAHLIATASQALTSMNQASNNFVDLNSLKDLMAIAKSKNVNLGIIDNSCHSGATLDLDDGHACIISASSKNQYGRADFARQMSINMNGADNLEDAYLATRAQVLSASFPLINTPIGKQVQDEFDAFLPYLKYHSEYRGMKLDKIDQYLISNSVGNKSCERDQSFLHLVDMLERWAKDSENTLSFFKASIFNKKIATLISKLKEMKELHDSYINRLKTVNFKDADLNKELNYNVNGNLVKVKMRDILFSNWDLSIKWAQESYDKTTDEAKKKIYAGLIAHYKEVKQSSELYKSGPRYREYQKIRDEIENDERLSQKAADEFGVEIRDLYQKRYSELSSKMGSGTNPCKDFKL